MSQVLTQDTTSSIPLIRDFVDRLYIEKQFGNLDQNISNQIKQDLYEETKTAIERALIEALDDVQLASYVEIVEHGDAKEAASFLSQNLLNHVDIINQTFASIRASYLLT